jgi:hypothetical protein
MGPTSGAFSRLLADAVRRGLLLSGEHGKNTGCRPVFFDIPDWNIKLSVSSAVVRKRLS